MVSAPLKISRARTILKPLAALEPGAIAAFFDDLAGEIDPDAFAGASGPPRYEFSLDLRYVKQAHEISVVVEPDWPAERIVAAFEDRHFTLYGTRHGHPVMVVTGRITAIADMPPLEIRPETETDRPAPPAERTTAVAGLAEPVAIIDRQGLRPGMRLAGPCLVEEVDTTFYVPPGASARVDPFRNLIITVKGGASA
nr:hypothetical protein [Prosthecomicrobium pneumaticum]